PKYATLVIFVKCIFALVPHTAETKRCFSTIRYHNTKYWNNIKTSILKVIEEQNELEVFTNLVPKFVIEQLVDIDDPILK
ncbi:8027_t:CDS:2, partial [Scutellospora calospora]